MLPPCLARQQSLTALVRDIRVTSTTGERLLRVTIAEDRAAIDAAIGRFGWALAVALVVLAVALIAAAWLQVHLGLRPLENLRHELEAIRRGNADRLDGKYPAEVVPLAVEVNELLAAQQTSIEFARARAADLAHGLKTPLSVLGTIAEKLRDRSDASTADEIESLGSEMAERVDYQLRLSRVRAPGRIACRTGRRCAARSAFSERAGWRAPGEIEVDETLAVDIDGRDLIDWSASCWRTPPSGQSHGSRSPRDRTVTRRFWRSATTDPAWPKHRSPPWGSGAAT